MQANQKIFDALQNVLTEEFVSRLVAYCSMKAARRRWYELFMPQDPAMAKGQQPEDIVQAVLLKTITGQRKWDGQRDLYDHLTSQIDSELDNLGKSWINRKFRRSSQMQKDSEEGYRENYFDTVGDEKTETPEEVALREEVEATADDFVSGFLDVLGEDVSAMAVVGEILDGARTPREIAAELEVEADDVYKARKRLRRHLDAYQVGLLEIEPVK